ncbi:hypothetical protein DCAR_0933758 [Daucus carota subsp. sativus]|uniref:Uncharacterized protein n=1 Tax=Daucus carota subsp. sativus TaxID=79200 RepID=A0AAF1BGR5_DAUCS|nr:hypothetical protein DCAR_0933758 [Daucus carota subsp. sativus]
MEKLADYTCDPEYLAVWSKLMKSLDNFKQVIEGPVTWIADIESFGRIDLKIVNEVLGPLGGGIERLMDESPSVTIKRGRLNQSIGLLKESKDVLAEIIDRIAIADD